MNEPEVTVEKSGFIAALTGVASDVFEEAKVLFYVTNLFQIVLFLGCHYLKEMSALGALLTGMWTGFGALVAKMAWGKNQ